MVISKMIDISTTSNSQNFLLISTCPSANVNLPARALLAERWAVLRPKRIEELDSIMCLLCKELVVLLGANDLINKTIFQL